MLDYDTSVIQFAGPLVVLVTLIGGGALIAGTFSLVTPTKALRVYGKAMDQHASRQSNRKLQAVENYEPIARCLSIRNVTLGLSILALCAYWQSLKNEDPIAAHVVQTCLGLMITIGSIVPAIDAYGAWKDGSESLRRSTTLLHLFRFCAWVAGGMWCLTT